MVSLRSLPRTCTLIPPFRTTWGELTIMNIAQCPTDLALRVANMVACLHNEASNKSVSSMALHSYTSHNSPQKIFTPSPSFPFTYSCVPLSPFEVVDIEDTLAKRLSSNRLKKRASKKIPNPKYPAFLLKILSFPNNVALPKP